MNIELEGDPACQHNRYYLFVLLGIIHVGSALWVYKDAKLRGQSLYWALGTALMPEAFFPIYFWRIEPKLILVLPGMYQRQYGFDSQVQALRTTLY